MNYRSPLANALGLGSARSGTGHWWLQRVTAVALIPLSFVLIRFLDLALYASYGQIMSWVSSPFIATCLVAWLLAAFYHAALGLRVVIEDYVGAEGVKIVCIWFVNLLFLFLTIAALIAVLRILLTG